MPLTCINKPQQMDMDITTSTSTKGTLYPVNFQAFTSYVKQNILTNMCNSQLPIVATQSHLPVERNITSNSTNNMTTIPSNSPTLLPSTTTINIP